MTLILLVAASAFLSPAHRLPLAGVLKAPQGSRRLLEWIQSTGSGSLDGSRQGRRRP